MTQLHTSRIAKNDPHNATATPSRQKEPQLGKDKQSDTQGLTDEGR